MRSDSPRCVLLDMGGVLMPEPPGYGRAARDVRLIAWLEARGVADAEAFVEDQAKRARQAYRDLSDECRQPDFDAALGNLEPEVRRRLLAAFKFEATRRVYPHAAAIVKQLARHYRLGLVSNTVFPGDHHARSLRRAGILDHFESAAWSANFGRRKPHPAMIRHVLAEMKLAPREAIFVGDKLSTDVLAAKRAGVRSIWLRHRHRPMPGPGDPEPDFTIRGIEALLPLLARL